MSDNTKIEWADATCNAINGCSLASPGCTNCYAMRLAGTRMKHHPSRAGLTMDTKAGPVWTGEVRLNETALLQPLRWKRPRRIFWNAHGDTFHDAVPDEWIDRVFAVCALTPQHTHMILTKRTARMREYMTAQPRPEKFTTINDDGTETPTPASQWRVHSAMTDLFGRVPPSQLNYAAAVAEAAGYEGFMQGWPLPNVWLGVSVEDQARADERIPDLLATPAAVRFVSIEPMLGPVDLTYIGVRDSYDEIDALTPINISVEWKKWIDGCDDPSADGDPEVLSGFVEQYGRVPDGKPIHPTLDWVIVGGESGPRARPMNPDWARSLRDQCAAAGVAFHFKQWGEWAPADAFGATSHHPIAAKNDGFLNWPRHYVICGDDRAVRLDARSFDWRDVSFVFRVGKARAGRLLDGIEHNGLPEKQA